MNIKQPSHEFSVKDKIFDFLKKLLIIIGGKTAALQGQLLDPLYVTCMTITIENYEKSETFTGFKFLP